MWKNTWKRRVLSLLLSWVLKSPFVSCSKMAAVGNKKRTFVVVWFTSPCSGVFTAQRLIDGGNIWLLCIAQRAHIYYTWHSVHLPETQPACSSITGNTWTHDKHFFSAVSKQASSTNAILHIFCDIRWELFFKWTVCYYVSILNTDFWMDADKWAKSHAAFTNFLILMSLSRKYIWRYPDSTLEMVTVVQSILHPLLD